MSGRVVIAGASSGVGKTTLACAIMAAFARRGLAIQPFKAGPDYIDPSYHTLAAGRASRNLDSVLLPRDTLRSLFARAASGADLAVVEGVMGLFDGRSATHEEGSTAEIAKLLDAPVLVVLDVSAMSRTAAAIAGGLARFDPALQVAGFLLNRVGSPSHAAWVTEAVEGATGLPVLGALPRDGALTLPERHLGLVPVAERAPGPAYFARLADLAERHLALDRILSLAARPAPVRVPPAAPAPARSFGPTRIAIARDEAFTFYYEDALELLAASGAECVPFSPLRDAALPAGTQGIYLGGGFPELHAAALAANLPLLEAIRRAATAAGTIVYGECGGLMYLGRSLTDLDGRVHAMAGVVPIDATMRARRLTLGYRTVTALRPSPLLEEGEVVMGHEFHWAESAAPAGTAAYAIAERAGAPEGYARDNVLASYVHIHLASRPAMADRFVARCAGAGTA